MIATQTLRGRAVALVPRRLEQAALLARWLDDPEVRHWLHSSEFPPEQRSRSALETRIREVWADPSEVRFAIEADGAAIGDVGLLGIHASARRAEMSILIGEKPYWSRGYGADAIQTLLRFGFGDLGLRRITLIADADNLRGIACYRRCGFQHEGVLRAHRLRYGEPLDMVTMAVLREEFAALDADGRR